MGISVHNMAVSGKTARQRDRKRTCRQGDILGALFQVHLPYHQLVYYTGSRETCALVPEICYRRLTFVGEGTEIDSCT